MEEEEEEEEKEKEEVTGARVWMKNMMRRRMALQEV